MTSQEGLQAQVNDIFEEIRREVDPDAAYGNEDEAIEELFTKFDLKLSEVFKGWSRSPSGDVEQALNWAVRNSGSGVFVYDPTDEGSGQVTILKIIE